MITETDLFRGREVSQKKVVSIEDARESTTPAMELLFALATAFGAVVGVILTLAYADRIDAFFVSVVRSIWL